MSRSTKKRSTCIESFQTSDAALGLSVGWSTSADHGCGLDHLLQPLKINAEVAALKARVAKASFHQNREILLSCYGRPHRPGGGTSSPNMPGLAELAGHLWRAKQ